MIYEPASEGSSSETSVSLDEDDPDYDDDDVLSGVGENEHVRIQPIPSSRTTKYRKYWKGQEKASSSNAPQLDEEVLFDAQREFGEGEAQTPPPQPPRSPEGGVLCRPSPSKTGLACPRGPIRAAARQK